MNKNRKPIVCLITGPAGVGKSSVTKALAKKFSKTAVVNVDGLRHMIVKGYQKPWPRNKKEVKFQTSLGAKNAIALTDNFYKSGFSVFIEDVIGWRLFKKYSESFRGKNFKVFLLLPSVDSLLKRFDQRDKIYNGPGLRKITHELHKRFSENKDKMSWHVVDSSEQTLKETVNQIFRTLKK